MTHLRQANGILVVILVLFVGALVGCDPAREGEICEGKTFTTATPDCVRVAPPILGDYDGSIQDTIAGVGRVHVTISNRVDHLGSPGFSDISGTWRVTFSNPADNTGGSFDGTLTDLIITGTLTSSDPTRCSFVITATLVTADRLEGTYTSTNCSPARTGTFDISRN